MNTTSMMNHPRRGLTPNKRKEREFLKPSKFVRPSQHKAAVAAPTIADTKDAEPASKNQLLAGYLAHEFLNKGTLFGEPWNPARAGADKPAEASQERQGKRKEVYVEVADLLKAGGGVQLPGIINPTQLAQFLKL